MVDLAYLINELSEDVEKEKQLMKYCENNNLQYALEYHNGIISAYTSVLMRLKKLVL